MPELPEVETTRRGLEPLVRGATVVYAVATLGVALAGSLVVLLPAVLACGAAWLALLSTLHVSAPPVNALFPRVMLFRVVM